MNSEKNLYSFTKEDNDLWHIKLCDEKVEKSDYLTLDFFTERIDVPFEVYEKYLRTIDEERTFHTIIVVDTDRDKEIRMNMGDYDKIYVGDYDEAMKEEVESYIKEKNFSYSNRYEFQNGFGFSYITHLDNWFPTLGFYYRRIGLLRGGYADRFRETIDYPHITGNERNARILGEYLDTEYIEHVHGAEAAKKLKEHYENNFLNTFEYGTSCLYFVE
jgi:hypothetical protein